MHIIEFEGIRLPPFASFLEVASKIVGLPDETDEWFWRFTICAGREGDAEASVVARHARALLAALPSSVAPIADELHQRFPGCEAAQILDTWRWSLQQIVTLATERSTCRWYGDDSESSNLAGNSMNTILSAILDDNHSRVTKLLETDRGLALQHVENAKLYESKIFHWLYAADTALHLAAAGYRDKIARTLLTAGADPNATANHRRGAPLHYAADGYITGPAWDPKRQVKTIRILLNAGADIHARDKNGATALHRAVRTRCAAAVCCLLDAGADPTQKNISGSTAFHLAVQNTGRGGSGAEIAIAAQRQIIEEFLSRGVSPVIKDGKGKSVSDCVTSTWIRNVLSEHAG